MKTQQKAIPAKKIAVATAKTIAPPLHVVAAKLTEAKIPYRFDHTRIRISVDKKI